MIIIEVPDYIREIKLSNSQRPVYFEWNPISNEVKSKKKGVLQKYVKDINLFKARGNKMSINNIHANYCVVILHKNEIIGEVNKDESFRFYLTHKTYTQDKLKFCLATKDKQLVIANPNQVGQPNIRPIKGQDIYTSGEFIRAAVIGEIKRSLIKYLKDLPVIKEFPLKITLEIHDTIKAWTDNSADEIGRHWDVDNRAYPYCKAFPDVLMDLGKIPDDDRLRITQPPHPVFVPINEGEQRKLIFIIEKDVRECILNHPVYNGTVVREKIVKVRTSKVKTERPVKKEIQILKFKK
jgi:hypothetical protein